MAIEIDKRWNQPPREHWIDFFRDCVRKHVYAGDTHKDAIAGALYDMWWFWGIKADTPEDLLNREVQK